KLTATPPPKPHSHGHWMSWKGSGLLLWCLGASWMAAVAQPTSRTVTRDGPFTVYIATWRGCEEVCNAFMSYLTNQGLEVDFVVRSAERQRERLAEFVAEARALEVDLVATWGTTVTLGLVGPHDVSDPERYLTDIPVVYLYVGYPVQAKIAVDGTRSGRANVAGANIIVPMETQLRAIQSYSPIERLGALYTADEPNSLVNVNRLRDAALEIGLELVTETVALGEDGKPRADDIFPALERLKAKKPQFLYWISNSFLVINVEPLAEGIFQLEMPLFTSYELPMRRGKALLGLMASLGNAGAIGAYQAEQILRYGRTPGDLPTLNLTRFSLMINMETARHLELYPPMQMLRFAELIDPERDTAGGILP
ncbi:MAG: ABC transporter substrate-binding protein, partial [Candidatus Competibacterales bacterium]